jgi:putative membrane protein
MHAAKRAYDVMHHRRRPHGLAAALPVLLAVATVATQIAYPLVDGSTKRDVTVAAVVLFCLACVTHAFAHHGAIWGATFVFVAAGGSLLAEAVGVHTGLPFGDYRYSSSLGTQVLGVPVLVPMAWMMMAYPVFLAARRLSRRFVALVGGIGLAGWDVFLDPQMVRDGRWHWSDPTPALPGVPHVPLTNYAGWLLCGIVLMALLAMTLPRDRASETVPAALLIWTYVGSIVGNLFFFGTDAIALAGGLAMGVLVVPYAWSLWQSRP